MNRYLAATLCLGIHFGRHPVGQQPSVMTHQHEALSQLQHHRITDQPTVLSPAQTYFRVMGMLSDCFGERYYGECIVRWAVRGMIAAYLSVGRTCDAVPPDSLTQSEVSWWCTSAPGSPGPAFHRQGSDRYVMEMFGRVRDFYHQNKHILNSLVNPLPK